MIGKYLVWAALGFGVLGFFLPMMSVNQSGIKVSVSAMDLMGGAEGIMKEAAEQAASQTGQSKEVAGAAAQKAAADARKSAAGLAGIKQMTEALQKFVLIMFAPTILFLIVTLIGRKRYGRGLATLALLAGIAGVGLWAIVSGAVDEGKGGSLGFGMTLIMLGGVSGLLGGIMGLAKPEPKADAAAAPA